MCLQYMYFTITLGSWYMYKTQFAFIKSIFPSPFISSYSSSFVLCILVHIINFSSCLRHTISTFIEIIRTLYLAYLFSTYFLSLILKPGPLDLFPASKNPSHCLVLFLIFLLAHNVLYSDETYQRYLS